MQQLILNMLAMVGGIFSGSSSVHDAVNAVSNAVKELHELVVSVQAEIDAIKAGTPLPTKQLIEDVSDVARSVGDVVEAVKPELAPAVAAVEGAVDAGGQVLGSVLDAIQQLHATILGFQSQK